MQCKNYPGVMQQFTSNLLILLAIGIYKLCDINQTMRKTSCYDSV